MGDHDQSTLKHNDHLLLDQPLLRLPSELLRKNFRSAHFTIEKDTSALKTLLKESATSAVSGKANQDDVLKNLDAMIAKMRGVKRKLNSYAEEESRLHTQVAARISHIDELYSMNTVEDVRYEGWSRLRLDRLLTDYLLRHGFNESARQLADERGMQDLTDVDTFVAMSRIRESLLAGSVTEALVWCNENKKELRKLESKLEFMLRLQQYIEIVRSPESSRSLDAITHAKKHLIPYWNAYPKEVKQACGLLAFPPESPAWAAYANLYRQSRWTDLADLFTETHHILLSLPSAPLIHVALSSGLSALKTPACHSSSGDGKTPAPSTFGHGVCPICSVELNDLARNVPYAHHTKSHVEHDLLLLPNGRVYGKSRLDEQTKKAGLPWNLVKDPQSGDVFSAEQIKKVYIS